jgi:uncharacterized damage-inducible protein DinB
MDANAFRFLYDYHFTENHGIWEIVRQLPLEQFIQPIQYSHGSVRDQILHLMDVDDVWFSELQASIPSEPLHPSTSDDRLSIHERWNSIENNMQGYLSKLKDSMLFDKPIKEPEEDRNLVVWQVLLHVINHGTDHRAQLLRVLHDMGVKTTSQDFIFFVYDHA